MQEKQRLFFFINSYLSLCQVPDSKSFLDLSFDELRVTVQQNAQHGYSLAYIDTFTDHGQPRFSAVFRQHAIPSWVLQQDVSQEDLMMEAAYSRRYVPRMIVAYEKDGQLHYAGLWVDGNSG